MVNMETQNQYTWKALNGHLLAPLLIYLLLILLDTISEGLLSAMCSSLDIIPTTSLGRRGFIFPAYRCRNRLRKFPKLHCQ